MIEKIKSAEVLVKDYTDRVQREMEDRKELNVMLAAFFKSQKDEAEQKEKKLEVGRGCCCDNRYPLLLNIIVLKESGLVSGSQRCM